MAGLQLPGAAQPPSSDGRFGAWAVVAVEGNDGRQWGSNPAVRAGGPATAALGWGAPHVSCSSDGGSAGGM